MKDFFTRKRQRKILFSRIAVLVLIILVFILAKASYNAYKRDRFTSESLESANMELEKLQDRSQNLQDKTAELQTEFGLEREIRQRLPVAKEGERVIILVDREEEVGVPKNSTGNDFWEKMFFWLQ